MENGSFRSSLLIIILYAVVQSEQQERAVGADRSTTHFVLDAAKQKCSIFCREKVGYIK